MKTFTGLYTALITPFNAEGRLDREGLILLIERQLAANVDGIVILGTTGEAAALKPFEKREVISIARKAWPKKTLVVGTGANSTSLTIENTIEAHELGADCALIVSPYYIKPNQEGVYQHYHSIAQSTSLPILLYNNPSRAGVFQEVETIANLAQMNAICGIKESGCTPSHFSSLIDMIKKERPDFSIFAGDDDFTFISMTLGGDGVISVVSNLFPEKIDKMMQHIENNEYSLARKDHYDLLDLFKGLGLETNPIPIKAALKLCGLPSGDPRLPLTPLSEQKLCELKTILELYEKKTTT